MEFLSNLAIGFEAALSLQSLFYAFLGALLGTLIGVLPGLGPLATIAMLLPVTYGLEPLSALILLAGIYYGAQYGGSTTSILVNIPGESASVVTCLDGYQMARQGRGGKALAIAAIGSFFAGTVATVILALLSPALAEVAFRFRAPDYFSLMVLGLIGAVAMSNGSVLKALAMVLIGLALGTMGTDINSGQARFTFGLMELHEGLEFVVIAVGIYAFCEVIDNLSAREGREVFTRDISGLWLSRKELGQALRPILRGTGLGSIFGLLPGGGATLASFAAYTLEKRIAADPSRFGKGAIEGVAAPEAANNAAAQMSFVPLLTLGLPSNAVMALMLGAMMIHQIQPGPQVMTSNPALFWGLIVSMWIGNIALLVLNLPMVGLWVKLLTIPYRYLAPAILVFCCIGIFSISNSVFDIFMAVVLAVLGLIFKRTGCEPAPLLLGFVLGPLMEENFRRSLRVSRGDYTTFLTQPISATLLAIALLVLIALLLPNLRRSRESAFQE